MLAFIIRSKRGSLIVWQPTCHEFPHLGFSHPPHSPHPPPPLDLSSFHSLSGHFRPFVPNNSSFRHPWLPLLRLIRRRFILSFSSPLSLSKNQALHSSLCSTLFLSLILSKIPWKFMLWWWVISGRSQFLGFNERSRFEVSDPFPMTIVRFSCSSWCAL